MGWHQHLAGGFGHESQLSELCFLSILSEKCSKRKRQETDHSHFWGDHGEIMLYRTDMWISYMTALLFCPRDCLKWVGQTQFSLLLWVVQWIVLNSRSLPQSKRMHTGLIGNSWLSVGVCGCLFVSLCGRVQVVTPPSQQGLAYAHRNSDLLWLNINLGLQCDQFWGSLINIPQRFLPVRQQHVWYNRKEGNTWPVLVLRDSQGDCRGWHYQSSCHNKGLTYWTRHNKMEFHSMRLAQMTASALKQSGWIEITQSTNETLCTSQHNLCF